MMKQINSFLSGWKKLYSQQGAFSKFLIPGVILLLFCFLCSILISLFPLLNSPQSVPSPGVFPSQGIQVTPTALFNFGTVTFVPFPTFPAPSALPTVTSASTETETATSTQALPTVTNTALPTVTAEQPQATATSSGAVVIVAVNRAMEYVDIQNLTSLPVDLSGWKLVSETGNQSCTLRGVLQMNEVLRVWARRGNPGLSCRFTFNIWNDNQADPAVLYNAQGQEVSRVP